MKITINGKKIIGTPKKVVQWMKNNLSKQEQEDFIEKLKGLKEKNLEKNLEISNEECHLMLKELNKNISIKDMITNFGIKRPDDNFKIAEDGKVEIPILIKKNTEKRLEIVKKKENKTTNEVVEKLLDKETKRFGNIDFTEVKGMYDLMEITENDRLKNFQIVKKFLTNGYENCLSDLEIGNKEQKEFAEREYATYTYYINPVMKELKLFELEDEVVPMLTLQDFDEQKSPFPSIGIDCNVWLECKGQKNFYFGFVIGSYFTEDNVHYRGVTTVYAKNKSNGEYELNKEMFILEKKYCKKLTGHTGEKQYGKLRRFIYAFLNYINSPEIIIKDIPYNPKNNERREKRGKIALPPSSKVHIHGTVLRKYVDDINEGIRTFGYNHRFWVRGHYEHFWNKKKYHIIYRLCEEDRNKLKKMGYDIKEDGTIRKWKKAFIKGQGLMLEKEYIVTK